MLVTARQLNRATLERQMLLQREQVDVGDAVRRVAGLQAQEPASPYLALWNRIANFDPAQLDAAFDSGVVVKASLLRLTLHAVHADDYPVLHAAMLPALRASRLADRRFVVGGRSAAEVEALVPELVDFAQSPHSGAELEAFVSDRLGDGGREAWWALRRFAPLHHVPSGHPWAFRSGGPYRAAPTSSRPHDAVTAAEQLIVQYLRAFGPAAGADVATFAMLRQAVVKPALAGLVAVGAIVTVHGPAGEQLFDVVDATCPSDDTPAPPRLLPMWDNILLAYADRSRVLPTVHPRT